MGKRTLGITIWAAETHSRALWRRPVPRRGLPLVSVIIPTYNYGRYLGKALASCRDQTYKGLEIIVVDDGSTDDTRGVVERFGPDVVYIFQENQGVSRARNTGLAVGRGELLTFLDADDYLLPDSIAARVEILRSRPDIGIVFSDTFPATRRGTFHTGKRGKGTGSPSGSTKTSFSGTSGFRQAPP